MATSDCAGTGSCPTRPPTRRRGCAGRSPISSARSTRSYQAYSHTVFVALIRSVWLNPQDAPPLLYHGGLYSQLESAAEQAERFHWELREG